MKSRRAVLLEAEELPRLIILATGREKTLPARDSPITEAELPEQAITCADAEKPECKGSGASTTESSLLELRVNSGKPSCRKSGAGVPVSSHDRPKAGSVNAGWARLLVRGALSKWRKSSADNAGSARAKLRSDRKESVVVSSRTGGEETLPGRARPIAGAVSPALVLARVDVMEPRRK